MPNDAYLDDDVKSTTLFNSVAFNYASIVGCIYFIFAIFNIMRFLHTSIFRLDCGQTCPPSRWSHYNYFFDNMPDGIFYAMAIFNITVFLLLCVFLKKSKIQLNLKNIILKIFTNFLRILCFSAFVLLNIIAVVLFFLKWL